MSRRSRALLLTAAVALLGCEPNNPIEPEPEMPEIVISGVSDGESYPDSVTITIDVSPGTYTATLDGESFVSGRVVRELGDHRLIVDARNQGVTASDTVDFEIVYGGTPGSGVVLIRMIDLGDNGPGGGDAILVTDSTATGPVHMLIDGGPGGAGGDASDPGLVARRLVELGVARLDIMLLTHAHSDHFGGMPDVARQIPIERFIYNGQKRDYSGYNNAISVIESNADTTIVPGELQTYTFGADSAQTQLDVVPPLDTYLDQPNADGGAMNEGSIGTWLEHGSFEMFFTGDGEVEANQRWRTEFADYNDDIDVLKVGHHGANNSIFDDGSGWSSASAWLDHTSPEVAVISANGSSHPRQRALSEIQSRSTIQTYCTPVHGDITIRVEPSGSYTVTVARNADADCVPGSEATT